MQTSPLLTQLMEALRCLPGVGPKSAQRMAFTLLQRDRSGGMRLAQALTRAMSEATANYIAELCGQYGVDASRIAHGVPVGGELEMVDGTTLSHSLVGRHKIVF